MKMLFMMIQVMLMMMMGMINDDDDKNDDSDQSLCLRRNIYINLQYLIEFINTTDTIIS